MGEYKRGVVVTLLIGENITTVLGENILERSSNVIISILYNCLVTHLEASLWIFFILTESENVCAETSSTGIEVSTLKLLIAFELFYKSLVAPSIP